MCPNFRGKYMGRLMCELFNSAFNNVNFNEISTHMLEQFNSLNKS